MNDRFIFIILSISLVTWFTISQPSHAQASSTSKQSSTTASSRPSHKIQILQEPNTKKVKHKQSPAKDTGFYFAFEWLPEFAYYNQTAARLRPLLVFKANSEEFSFSGRVALSTQVTWLLPNKNNIKTFNLSDLGSVVRLGYRWQSKKSKVLWSRELSFRLYPLNKSPVQLGETLELLWTPYNQKNRNLMTWLPTAGLEFQWSWFRIFIALQPTRFRQLISKGQLEERLNLSAMSQLEYSSGKWFKLFVHGATFQAGTFDNPGVKGKQYGGWGLHAGGIFWLGKQIKPTQFLYRRQQDPRRNRLFLDRLPLIQEKGIELVLESGLHSHKLTDSENVGQLKIQNAWSFGARLNGQWGRFRANFSFHWRDLSWLLYDIPGFVPYEALSTKAVTAPALKMAAGFETVLSRSLLLALRLELFQPSTYFAKLPASMIPNSKAQRVLVYAPGNTILTTKSQVDWRQQWFLQLRWEFLQQISVVSEVWISIDSNEMILTKDQVKGTVVYVRTPKTHWQVGTELLIQARF